MQSSRPLDKVRTNIAIRVCLSFLMPFVGIAMLTACSNNTIIDDGDYRAIGGGNPRNPHPSAPPGLTDNSNFSLNADEGLSGNPDFSYEGGVPKGSLANATPQQGSHVRRYGNSGAIEKIAKIARIHCQPQTFSISTNKRSFWGKQSGLLTQCHYAFPKFCGGHHFTVLSYSDKEVLIYDQADAPYYIVDTLKGTNSSRPGLWDKDDKLGSKASNMGYMFEAEYDQAYQKQHPNHPNRNIYRERNISKKKNQNTPLNLGWVIKASYHDEIQHGTKYHQAIAATTKCF